MNETKMWNRKFIQLMLLELFFQFGMYSIRPIVSTYCVALGATIAVAGFIAGLNSTTSICFRPIAGVISDRLAKKQLLIISSILFMLSSIGCALATSAPMVGVCYAFQGLAFAFKSAIVVSMVRLVVPQERVGSAVGWLGTMLTVAIALGPALGQLIGNMFGHRFCFVISAIMFFCGLILVLTFQPPAEAAANKVKLEKTTKDEKGAEKTSNGIVAGLRTLFYFPSIPFSLIAGFSLAAQGTTIALILLVEEMNLIEGAALYFVVYAVVSMVTRPMSGRLADKWGALKLAPVFLVIAMCGMLTLAFFRTPVAVVVAAFLMGLGQASAYASLQGESMRRVPADKTGRAANTFYIFPDLGMGLGPLLGGFMLETFGATVMYLTNMGMLVCGFIGVLILGIVNRRRDALEAAQAGNENAEA